MLKLDTKQPASNMRRLLRRFSFVAVTNAVRAEAKDILDAANELVPIDTGKLKESGRVVDAKELHKLGTVSGPITTGVRIEYGGDEAPHALAVHEHLSGFSPPSWQQTEVKFKPPRGPKFLERAINRAANKFTKNVFDRLKNG